MGYDMHWRQKEAGQDGYFRLNIWGMDTYRRLMNEFGMVFEDAPFPPFPDFADYGLTAAQYWAVEDASNHPGVTVTVDADVQAACDQFNARKDEIRRMHQKEIPGIPLHKFGSNDGWIVAPAECRAAVEAWQQYCAENGSEKALARVREIDGDSDYWQQWITYLTEAAKHDGFEVW